MEDQELLQQYRAGSDSAFEELVRRRLGLVYGVALRRCGQIALAEEVTQAVFILLARKAPSFGPGTVLSAWLFRTTRFVASRALRAERRRQNREQEALEMQDMNTPDDGWRQVVPLLDEALECLGETDRKILLLRHWEEKSLGDAADIVGLGHEATKKRSARALEKLRAFFRRRGFAIPVATVAVAMNATKADAVPSAISGKIAAQAMRRSAGSAGRAGEPLVSATLAAWRMAWLVRTGIVAIGFIFGASVWRTPETVTRVVPALALQSAQMRPRAVSPLSKKRVLTFHVVSAETGEPVAGAQIAVDSSVSTWNSYADLKTDAEGNCQILLPATPFGRIDIGALKDGFVERFFTWREDSGEPLPQNYTLSLAKASPIAGRVQDSAGNPIADAEIGLSFYGISDVKGQVTSRERFGFIHTRTVARTDANGNWRCDVTPKDYSDYAIVVSHPGFVRQRNAAASSPGPVVTLQRAAPLNGFVLDEAGAVVVGAIVRRAGPDTAGSPVETTTDQRGVFHLTGLAPGVVQISAWAQDFAPRLLDLDLNSNSPPQVFHLDHGTNYDVQVVDDDGYGIAGAHLTAEFPGSEEGVYREDTDGLGTATFTGVPTNILGEIRFTAAAPEFFLLRDASPDQSDGLAKVRLTRALRVTGRVVDDATGERITGFNAIPCDGFGGDTIGGYDRIYSTHSTNGAYAVTFHEMTSPLRVRIEAEGYEAAMSAPLSLSPSSQTQNFRLRHLDASRLMTGTVLQTDGRPAANVAVALVTFDRSVVVSDGAFDKIGQPLLATTDTNGAFSFAPDAQAHTLVAADREKGFCLQRMRDRTNSFVLTLQPWGRIEGQLLTNGEPAAGQSLYARLLNLDLMPNGYFAASPSVTTDSEGRFAIDHMPPGDYFVARYGPGIPFARGTAVTVRSREITQAQLGAGCATVFGRLSMPQDAAVDWRTQLVSASLVSDRDVISPPTVQPPSWQYPDAKRARLDFFDQAEDWKEFARADQYFEVPVNPDGSFRVDDVPPGPYLLRVDVSDIPCVPGDFFNDRMKALMRKKSASLRLHLNVPEDPTSHFTLGPPSPLPPLDLGCIALGSPVAWGQ